MRVVIDPNYPGGFKVESPFRMNGLDDNYYLRQIQWMISAGNTFIGKEHLDEFIIKEIRKIAPKYRIHDKDYSVFVLEKIPLLSIRREKYKTIYEDLSRVYDLMVEQRSLIQKENIVNNIYKYVVEKIMKYYFNEINKGQLVKIQKSAIRTFDTYDSEKYIDILINDSAISKKDFPWRGTFIRNTIGRLSHTYGNSIVEKFINMLVVRYHYRSSYVDHLVKREDINHISELIEKLNLVRRKVAHDTDEMFREKDYNYFISNVFDLINALLESLERD